MLRLCRSGPVVGFLNKVLRGVDQEKWHSSKILGVALDADAATLKTAHGTLAMKWCPGNNPDNHAAAQAKSPQVSDAYNVLSGTEKRSVYDRWCTEGLKAGAPTHSILGMPAFHVADRFFLPLDA
jgi:DnaJ-class molecular chaperone